MSENWSYLVKNTQKARVNCWKMWCLAASSGDFDRLDELERQMTKLDREIHGYLLQMRATS